MALSTKQRAFIHEYLQCFNATQAALNAGYSERSARTIGAENLTKHDIADAISQHLQASAMSADEALMRLADQARGDMSDFISLPVKDKPDADGNPAYGFPYIDLGKALAAGKLHLVKEFARTETIRETENGEQIISRRVNIKLYDAQSALTTIAKGHGVLDKRGSEDEPLHTVQMSLDEWKQQQTQQRSQIAETLAEFEDET